MDTHVNDASLAHPGIGLATPIGLPGESAREPAETVPQRPGFGGGGSDPGLVTDNDLSQALDAKQRRRARRQALLAGSAFIAISGLVGSTAYVFQDDIRNGNVRNISLQSIHLPASVSGLFLSASGTRSAVQEVRALSRTTVGPVFPAAAAPRAVAGPAFEAGSGAALGPSLASVVLPVPVQPTATPAVTDRRAVLAAELAALKVSGTADTAVESAPQLTPARQLDDAKLLLPPVIPMAVSPVAPVQALVAEPELTLPLRVAVPPVAVVLVSPPAVVLAPTVAPPPSREPAAIAADLRAGPMTPAQQVEVIGLVKSLGAQLRDTRIEVAQLHRVVTQLSNQVPLGK